MDYIEEHENEIESLEQIIIALNKENEKLRKVVDAAKIMCAWKGHEDFLPAYKNVEDAIEALENK